MASDSGHGGSRHHGTPRTDGRAPAPGAARDTTAPGGAPAPLPAAARHRTTRRPHPAPERAPRPRVEVHVNELTGTMSWRTLGAHAARPAHAPGPAHDRHGGPGDTGPLPSRTAASRLPAEAPFSVRAAALRSAGLDPARAPAKGAAPIPTHPAAVRASLSVDVASLGPEQLRLHMARIGALRSAVAADLAHGTRLPAAAASRLRSTTATPSHAHALTAEHTATPTAIRRAATTRTATTRTASAPRTTTATTTHPPTPAARPTPAPGAPHGR